MKDKVKFLIYIIVSILVLNFLNSLNIIVVNSIASSDIYNESISIYNLLQDLFSTLTFGILIGSAAYMVFVCQSSGKRKLLNYLCNLLVTSILMTIYFFVYGSFGEKYTFLQGVLQVLYYVVILGIPYIVIIAIVNLINYIYQRILIKKLNAELNKDNINKLNKKILLTTIIAVVFIVVIVVAGLVVFNSAVVA